jgi:hypothetical protein
MFSMSRRPSGHSYSKRRSENWTESSRMQVVGACPLVDLLDAARGSPVALGLIAVAGLREGLVLALEVILEHHALDAAPWAWRRSALRR